MNDRLEQILMAADSAAPPPDGEGLAGRVRERFGRQRLRRRLGGAMGLLAAAIGGMWMVNRPERREVVHDMSMRVASAEEIRFELTELRREGEAREVLVRELEAAERRVEARRRERMAMGRPSAMESIRRQQDMAAVVVLHDAQRIEGRPGRREDAMERYEWLLELFPASPAAAEARERLGQLKG